MPKRRNLILLLCVLATAPRPPVPAERGSVSVQPVNESARAGNVGAAATLVRAGATVERSEERLSAGGARERLSLWRMASEDTPWIVVRETFAPAGAPDAPARAEAAWCAWAADRVLVSVAAPAKSPDGATASARDEMRDRTNARLVALGYTPARGVTFSQVWRARISDDVFVSLDGVDVALARLDGALPAGVRVQRDYVLFPAATPNDPRYGDQWALPRVRAPEAWDLGTGSAAVVVALFDTGIDLGHADLAGNLFTNPGEAGLRANNGVDDDGNGLIDDAQGWDFEQNDAEPQDTAGHGTSVAGAVGAVGNNSNGVAGINWTTGLLPLRTGAGSFALSNLIQALDYVIDLRARHGLHVAALNFSLGGYLDGATPAGDPADEFHAAFVRARTAGLLVVAAAGNDALNLETTPFFPACYQLDNIIAVVGTARPDGLGQDTLYSSTNYGTVSADLGAPAVDVRTTLLGGNTGPFTGTSVAAPLVSGALALAASQSGPLPAATWRQLLLATVDAQPALLTRCASGGRLNVRELAQAARLRAWKNAQFATLSTDPAIAGNLADPDDDGAANLLEYLRGTSPLSAAGNDARRDTFVVSAVAGSPVYEFTYWRARTAAHVTIVLETTASLNASLWSAATVIASDVVETAGNGDQRVRVRVARSATERMRFFRLRAIGATE